VAGQTQVDLRTQGKDVDFSTAPLTRPARTGTGIPSTCETGELFYLLTAPAGQNLYGCTSTNVFTLESGGSGSGGAGMASMLGDLAVTLTTPNTVLTMGANCSASTPCNVRIGDTVYAFTTPATATISSGSPTAYFYVDSSGNRSIGVASGTVSCNSSCLVTNAATFPAGSVSVWTWTAVSGAWVTNGGTDLRAWLGVKPNPTAGAALVQSGNQIGFDTTTGLQQTLVNASSPGTSAGLLAKLSGGQVVMAATSDTSGVVGICSSNCGTAGTATVVTVGLSACIADNTVTAGDYIQIGTSTAGRCKSAGATKPASGQIVGRATSTASAGNTFSILLFAAP
jgi:hypothetical protein